MLIFEKLVFLVHFKPWDLSRKMRREILTEFSSGIIDFENKNISIVPWQDPPLGRLTSPRTVLVSGWKLSQGETACNLGARLCDAQVPWCLRLSVGS